MISETELHVGFLRAKRQHAIGRHQRLSSKKGVSPKVEKMRLDLIRDNQNFIRHLESELEVFERKLGWR